MNLLTNVFFVPYNFIFNVCQVMWFSYILTGGELKHFDTKQPTGHMSGLNTICIEAAGTIGAIGAIGAIGMAGLRAKGASKKIMGFSRLIPIPLMG